MLSHRFYALILSPLYQKSNFPKSHGRTLSSWSHAPCRDEFNGVPRAMLRAGTKQPGVCQVLLTQAAGTVPRRSFRYAYAETCSVLRTPTSHHITGSPAGLGNLNSSGSLSRLQSRRPCRPAALHYSCLACSPRFETESTHYSGSTSTQHERRLSQSPLFHPPV